MTLDSSEAQTARNAWRKIVSSYEQPSRRKALWQIANTFIPYVALWYVMYLSLNVSYWLALAIGVVAAGFLSRIFIMLHDCGHGSFFKSKWANDCLGFVAGVLSFTPYHYWRYMHAIHHATVANLDRRGTGDIWTLTVDEYKAAPFYRKFRYRFYRNPFVLIIFGSLFTFMIKHRAAHPKHGWRWQRSVQWSNLGMLVMIALGSWAIGFKDYMLLQIPIMSMAAAAGIWLFYVQHQFEGVHWEREENCDFFTAAMEGSSFYKLPRVLQWFSGNIGFHHIHHLSPRIPNYRLERCHYDNPPLQKVKTLSMRESFDALKYRLWDEQRHELIPYGPAWL